MVSLLDVNLLIALAWPNHVHHRTALRWFDRNRKSGWATCPLTQSGFVRVSSNVHILPGARSPREALALLRRIVGLPDHVFWQDDFSIATSDLVDETRLLGHRQITDAHVLAVALQHGGQLATLDRGLTHLVPASHSAENAVHLVLDET
ncbi:MAG TPA: TA system VapC family ribonuclease toxin [Thermoanaerobaculia bacterium]|nr:TA system VapC family ribonuclease toxin [Thermoanaerobaculia bacterium]